MRKGLGFILGAGSVLLAITTAFATLPADAAAAAATSIPFAPPTGSENSVSLQNVPQFLVTLLFVVGVVAALAFLIYGGIKWIISGGDKAAVDAARKHIVAAIIGLVIVVSAFLILNFVFTLLFGHNFDLGHLCIPSLSNPTCN